MHQGCTVEGRSITRVRTSGLQNLMQAVGFFLTSRWPIVAEEENEGEISSSQDKETAKIVEIECNKDEATKAKRNCIEKVVEEAFLVVVQKFGILVSSFSQRLVYKMVLKINNT